MFCKQPKNRKKLDQGQTSQLPRQCLHRWDDEYLLSTLHGLNVSVNVTPNGRADAVETSARGWFVKPLEETMSFQDSFVYFCFFTKKQQVFLFKAFFFLFLLYMFLFALFEKYKVII